MSDELKKTERNPAIVLATNAITTALLATNAIATAQGTTQLRARVASTGRSSSTTSTRRNRRKR